MKTIFDKASADELIHRVQSLTGNSPAQWGKMNAFQMVKHSRLWTEMMLGTLPCKRVFLGRIFGTMALKGILKDESPMARNSPSSKELIVTDPGGDFAAEQKKYIDLIEQLAGSTMQEFNHAFFGKMTREQVGQFSYKHIDHHLRQFGV